MPRPLTADETRAVSNTIHRTGRCPQCLAPAQVTPKLNDYDDDTGLVWSHEDGCRYYAALENDPVLAEDALCDRGPVVWA